MPSGKVKTVAKPRVSPPPHPLPTASHFHIFIRSKEEIVQPSQACPLFLGCRLILQWKILHQDARSLLNHHPHSGESVVENPFVVAEVLSRVGSHWVGFQRECCLSQHGVRHTAEVSSTRQRWTCSVLYYIPLPKSDPASAPPCSPEASHLNAPESAVCIHKCTIDKVFL